MKYLNKELSDYTLPELELIWLGLNQAEAQREEASQHPKFNMDRTLGNKVVKKLDFPPPNPAFVELKSAIAEEIRKKQNA